jgi:uncharacterized Zn-binding protein involved in type VI secretion
MGKQIQRVGDKNSAGAPITTSNQSSVYLNGKLIAVEGSHVQDHGTFPTKHTNVKTRSTSSDIYIEGKKVSLEGDKDSCGHRRMGGGSDTFMGG